MLACAGASKAFCSVGRVDSFELILDGGREGGAAKEAPGTGSDCSILKAGVQTVRTRRIAEGGKAYKVHSGRLEDLMPAQ